MFSMVTFVVGVVVASTVVVMLIVLVAWVKYCCSSGSSV